MSQNRIFCARGHLKEQEIKDFVFREDTNDLNNFLVFNGGTGLGKTRQAIITFKDALYEKHQKKFKILFVESRRITVDQIENNYNEQIETFGGIIVKQRVAFMNMIKNGEIENYDWIIIDECHGLFSEASFAEDSSFIANWIRCGRTIQHVTFITANDEYFIDIFQRYFPNNYKCSQLFEDLQTYYSSTYVKQAVGIITNTPKVRIRSLIKSLKDKKGILFFKQASKVKDWYFEIMDMGIGLMPFPIVSLANQTSTNLSTIQEKRLRDLEIDYSGGRAGLTMADFEAAIDSQRVGNGKESVRRAITMRGEIPSDIDILLATDTLQEGMDIKSHIDYIIIEGYTEVEVRQKLGRYRNPLDILYLVINPGAITREFNKEQSIFEEILQLELNNEQIKLAELYGNLKGLKWQRNFIIKEVIDGKEHYKLNREYYEDFLRRKRKFLSSNSKQYVMNLLSPHVKDLSTDIIFLEGNNFLQIEANEAIDSIMKKWAGIPLKGEAQNEFLEDCISYDLRDSRGKIVDTFQKCLNALRKSNVKISERKATKRDLEKYPNYLTTIREKYNFIE